MGGDTPETRRLTTAACSRRTPSPYGSMIDGRFLSGSARLRVDAIDYRPGADGTGSVEVRLSHTGRTLVGRGNGLMTREGHLRMAADAAMEAVREATQPGLALVLGGIKAVRAFDSWLVIVSIDVEVEGEHLRVLGAQAAEGANMVRGAVHAVLDALNRVAEPHL